MSDFTPGLDQLRSSYVARWYEQTVKQSKAEFDRAIAKVRADAKAEAWDEGWDAGWINAWDNAQSTSSKVATSPNPYRADSLEAS